MKLQLSSVLWVVLVVGAAIGPSTLSGQQFLSTSVDHSAAPFTSPSLSATTPTGFTLPKLVGVFSSDGRFKQVSKLKITRPSTLRPSEVPSWIQLRSAESVVEDYGSRSHGVKAIKARSAFGNFRDRVVALAYGEARVFAAPTHLTTDSRNRLLISDPEQACIHVMDGEQSFRIVGGSGRRLQQPQGIAVDHDDNIYVADSERRLILVYDAQGKFLRQIGKHQSESIFQQPTAIAIHDGKLLVLDPPVHQLMVLSLNGETLRRIGGYRRLSGISFEQPSELALAENGLAVIDAYGTRLQLLTYNFELIRTFNIRSLVGVPSVREMGLAVDSQNDIYVSAGSGFGLRVYGWDGALKGQVGDSAIQGDHAPAGLWIDSSDRMYAADRDFASVEVFERM
jgi:hypothetical protein